MQNNGIVVYLCAPVSAWLTDCKLHRKKIYEPTLTGKPLSEEVQEVLEERDALYREVAHIIIDATNEPSQVILKFAALWHRRSIVDFRAPILNVHPVK